MDAVRDYYRAYAEREASRLDRPADGAVERYLHERAFAEHLPPAPARVLDLGGGPGGWALWLAGRGYRVTLADPSPDLLDIARARFAAAPHSAEAIVEADARDLGGFADAAFDAVLALGPFYHLPEPADRERAAAEVRRVLRPGGSVFAAFMPPYMRLVATVLERGSAAFDGGVVERILRAGRYDDERVGRFTGGHLTSPAEVDALFARHGFVRRRVMASQGVLGWAQAEVAALAERDPDAYRRLLDVAYETADDPSILGMAAHILFIGEKSDGVRDDRP